MWTVAESLEVVVVVVVTAVVVLAGIHVGGSSSSSSRCCGGNVDGVVDGGVVVGSALAEGLCDFDVWEKADNLLGAAPVAPLLLPLRRGLMAFPLLLVVVVV